VDHVAGNDTVGPHPLLRQETGPGVRHGADNGCFLPSSTEESFGVLSAANGAGLYQRRVVAGYGHSDCLFGKHASHDVFPLIVEHLDANQTP